MLNLSPHFEPLVYCLPALGSPPPKVPTAAINLFIFFDARATSDNEFLSDIVSKLFPFEMHLHKRQTRHLIPLMASPSLILGNTLRKMAVPKLSQLRKGVGVNIVLKADQRTGKLTTGNISDILTRGDHPRGIKVRLTNGQIGRVQALAPSSQVIDTDSVGENGVDLEPEPGNAFRQDSRHVGAGRGAWGSRGLQEDHRLEPVPQESLSLFDYIRAPSKTARVPTSETVGAASTPQELLESEFPKLDTALISAILVDYPGIAEARTVLSSLS